MMIVAVLTYWLLAAAVILAVVWHTHRQNSRHIDAFFARAVADLERLRAIDQPMPPALPRVEHDQDVGAVA